MDIVQAAIVGEFWVVGWEESEGGALASFQPAGSGVSGVPDGATGFVHCVALVS